MEAVLVAAVGFGWWLYAIPVRRRDLAHGAARAGVFSVVVGLCWELAAGASAAAVLATIAVAAAVVAVGQVLAADGSAEERRAPILEQHLGRLGETLERAGSAAAGQAALTEATRTAIKALRDSHRRR